MNFDMFEGFFEQVLHGLIMRSYMMPRCDSTAPSDRIRPSQKVTRKNRGYRANDA
jgi:hypothetical protein